MVESSLGLRKQTLWSMAPLLTVTLLNFASVPLFYRFLGPERYALWFYVLTLSGSFGFMDLGLGVAVGRYIGIALGRNDHAAIREYWGTANAIAIPIVGVASLFFIIVGTLFGPSWFNAPQHDTLLLQWSFLVGGLALFFSYYGQFWNILSQAHLDYQFIGILRTASTIIQVLVSLWLAFWKRSPPLLILWSAIVSAMQLVFYVVHARYTYNLGLQFRHRSWLRLREMALFTAKSFATLLLGALFGPIDRLILGKLAPPVDFAHYSIAANGGARIQGLSTAVMGPVFTNTNIGLNEPGRPARIYNETFSFIFGWIVLLVSWSIVWHQLFLRLWLGPELGNAVGVVFPVLLTAFCLNAIANISASQFGPLNRVGTLALFQTSTGLFTVAAVCAGWKLFGLPGVAYGYLVARIGDVLQDLYVLRTIGAGGWLATSTWITVILQGCVALVFYSLNKAIAGNMWTSASLAVAHGISIAGYLIYRQLRA